MILGEWKACLLGYNAYIKIKDKNAYLYQAVDSTENMADFYVSERRDNSTAKKLLRKALVAIIINPKSNNN